MELNEYIYKYAMKTGDKAAPVIGGSAVLGGAIGAVASREHSLRKINEKAERIAHKSKSRIRIANIHSNIASDLYEKNLKIKGPISQEAHVRREGARVFYNKNKMALESAEAHAGEMEAFKPRATKLLKGKINKGILRGGVKGVIAGSLVGGTILGYNRIMDKIEEVPRT